VEGNHGARQSASESISGKHTPLVSGLELPGAVVNVVKYGRVTPQVLPGLVEEKSCKDELNNTYLTTRVSYPHDSAQVGDLCYLRHNLIHQAAPLGEITSNSM